MKYSPGFPGWIKVMVSANVEAAAKVVRKRRVWKSRRELGYTEGLKRGSGQCYVPRE